MPYSALLAISELKRDISAAPATVVFPPAAPWSVIPFEMMRFSRHSTSARQITAPSSAASTLVRMDSTGRTMIGHGSWANAPRAAKSTRAATPAQHHRVRPLRSIPRPYPRDHCPMRWGREGKTAGSLPLDEPGVRACAAEWCMQVGDGSRRLNPPPSTRDHAIGNRVCLSRATRGATAECQAASPTRRSSS